MAHPKIFRFRNISAGWWVASLLILLLLFCSAYLFYPTIRARYLFSELATLQLGRSTFDDAQQLAKKIGAKPNGPCNRSACEWEVRMGNSGLPHWWRGAGEAFAVAFDVKDGLVVRKNTGYGVGTETDTFFPSSLSLEEQEHLRRDPGREQIPVQAGWYTTELYHYYQFRISMTPKASAEQRRRYTAFNFNCLWKYKGCKDARELLPTADPFPSDK